MSVIGLGVVGFGLDSSGSSSDAVEILSSPKN
jgi:hypothetical protein